MPATARTRIIYIAIKNTNWSETYSWPLNGNILQSRRIRNMVDVFGTVLPNCCAFSKKRFAEAMCWLFYNRQLYTWISTLMDTMELRCPSLSMVSFAGTRLRGKYIFFTIWTKCNSLRGGKNASRNRTDSLQCEPVNHRQTLSRASLYDLSTNLDDDLFYSFSTFFINPFYLALHFIQFRLPPTWTYST